LATINIKISDLINNTFAVTTEEGEILFNEILKNFEEGNKIILDFTMLEIIISTFFNASIGQLYSIYDGQFLKENLSIINLSNDDLNVLAKVIERAKQYFKDKQSFENLLNQNKIASKQNNKN